MAAADPMKRYEKVKQIGKGTYGKVSLMRDRKTNELVVMKVIPIKAKDQKGRQAAMKEARVLSMLQHPCIIGYLNSFFDQHGDFCIVLEYADGQDLQKYLESHGEVRESQIVQIFAQVILGLDYIHSQNILHRDIKTANVFLFRKGLVKLGDFGIAREVSAQEMARTLIGTPYFMSPELLKGQSYSFPADVWAAGCVLFELMCRKHAFTGSSREELFGNIIGGQIPEMPTQYSKELTNLLKSMLAPDPAKRPTCKEILGSTIIGQGLEVLQTKLSKYFGQPTSPKPKVTPKRPQQKEAPPGEDIDNEIDQAAIPEWLIDNRGVGEELVRQSNRHLEKDNYRLLGVIRSSIKSLAPAVRGAGPPLGITGNLSDRKRRLEEEARRALGEKYDLAYRFVAKFGQEKRTDLLSQMGISAGGKIPELELRMIETLTAIEACE